MLLRYWGVPVLRRERACPWWASGLGSSLSKAKRGHKGKRREAAHPSKQLPAPPQWDLQGSPSLCWWLGQQWGGFHQQGWALESSYFSPMLTLGSLTVPGKMFGCRETVFPVGCILLPVTPRQRREKSCWLPAQTKEHRGFGGCSCTDPQPLKEVWECPKRYPVILLSFIGQ